MTSSPKGCKMEQSIDENNHNLEMFVKYFVKEFETKLTAYQQILEGEKNEEMKALNTFSEALGQAAGGLAGGILGYFLGASGAGNSAGKAVGRKVGSVVGNKMHLKEMVKLTDVVDLFLNEKAGFRRKLVEAGYDIFQSFEMQFNRVSTNQGPRKAFQLLARDAMNRAIDYFKQNKDASITEGVIFGKSIIEPVLGLPMTKPKTPGFKIKYEYGCHNKDWCTSSLYEKVGLVIEVKDSTETAIYYERKDGKSRTKKYGYRRLFTSETWETLKEEYKTSNVEKSDQFTGYKYILKSDLSEEKIKDILKIINLHDKTLEEERLTAIMEEVKCGIEEIIHFLKEQIAKTEEGHKILGRIEAIVRNQNVKDFLDQCELNSKQAREEHLKTAKSIKDSRGEREKPYYQLSKKQYIYHDDNRREHEKTRDGIQRIKQGIDSSGKNIDEIHKVIVPKNYLKKESIWFDVKVPVQQFTGRREELSDLHCKIQCSSGKLTVISQITSISGLGGVGKTELARQYVHEHQEDYDDVIWINAENKDILRETFMKLAKDELEINTKNADGAEKDEKSIVNEVYKYFHERRSLFVFDNAEVNNYLYQFLPLHYAKADAKIPQILFISCNQEWENGIQVILLNELTPDDAMAFVKYGLSIEDASQDKEIKILTGKLQYFPLAIQQAISYIEDQMKTGEYGISNYLKEYETRSGILLKSEVFQGIDNNYIKTTFTTWNIILDKIKNDKELGQLAVKILDIMAYLSPEKINQKLLLDLTDGKEELLASVIHLMVNYSIVNVEQQQSVLSIHRLVQQIIRLELKGQGREDENLEEVLQLIMVNIKEEILEQIYTLQNHVRKYGKLEENLRKLHHIALYLQNVRCKSLFGLLDSPDKLSLQIINKKHHPKVKQKRALCYNFYTWKELFVHIEKVFGFNMNAWEMENSWQFDPFEEDKDVCGMNHEDMEWRNGRTVLLHILSKGSAMNESENEENAADLNVKDTYGNTPLHLASAKGHLDTIKYLICDKNADVNVKNTFHCTPLHLAAQNGHLNSVKYLIDEKRADFEAENHFGQIPLHFAAANGHLDIVKYLIDEKSAGFDVPDYYNFTPLYLAAWNGKLNVIKYLVSDKGAKFDYFDDIPIDYMVKLYDTNIYVTNINFTQNCIHCLVELFITTPMHLAALRGHLDTLTYFFDIKGAETNARDVFGSTPLHSASQNGQLKTVEYLLNKKGRNVNIKNAFHTTPVHLAAQNGHLYTLRYLIDKKKAEFDKENLLSIFPVHLAAKNGHLDVLKYLIDDHNARFNVIDYERNTPLHLAALNGQLAIVQYLIHQKNANYNTGNADGSTPLHLAALNGHLAIVQYLIHEKNANYNTGNADGSTPLHSAALNGHMHIVQYLIHEKNANYNTGNADGSTPLHLAALNGHLAIVQYLIHEKNANYNTGNADGSTPLHLAALNGHLAIVQYLIHEKNANYNTGNADSSTPLHLAALNGHMHIVQYLIHEKNANYNTGNADGSTPLHLAALNGHLAIVQYLIHEKNANYNTGNADGSTPLHLAALNGHLAIVQYLIHEKNANYNTGNADSSTPLHLAALNGHMHIVQYLIHEKNANYNTGNTDGSTPLHLAALTGHLAIVQYLIHEKNANYNTGNADGSTPLHLAALNGHLAIVQYLIHEKNANYNTGNADGSTPLHLAALNGHIDIVQYLIEEKNANYNTGNADGSTPLHLAALNGQLAIVQYFIHELNVNLNKSNAEGNTPLDLAE